MDCLIDAVDEAFTNNDIDRDALVSFSTNYLEGEDPSPLFAQTMERCIVRIKEQIQADTNLKEHKLRHNRSCHRSLLKLTNCLNHEVFLNCPVNMWKNSNNFNTEYLARPETKMFLLQMINVKNGKFFLLNAHMSSGKYISHAGTTEEFKD